MHGARSTLAHYMRARAIPRLKQYAVFHDTRAFKGMVRIGRARVCVRVRAFQITG